MIYLRKDCTERGKNVSNLTVLVEKEIWKFFYSLRHNYLMVVKFGAFLTSFEIKWKLRLKNNLAQMKEHEK